MLESKLKQEFFESKEKTLINRKHLQRMLV